MKNTLCVSIIILLFLSCMQSWGISTDDFDNIVDFSVTLKTLSQAIDKNDFSLINKNKLVILNGTISGVRPEKSLFFLIEPADIITPSSFINKFRKIKDPITQFLYDLLSQEVKDSLQGSADAVTEKDLLKSITDDLKKILRRNRLYSKELFENTALPQDIREIAGRNLGAEELAFINRLLMEAAYPGEIKTVTMEVEVVYGTWISYDEVKSYKSIIEFKGTECFKIFNRKKPEDASEEAIRLNSSILAVVRIVKLITFANGEKGWLLEGIYVRGIR